MKTLLLTLLVLVSTSAFAFNLEGQWGIQGNEYEEGAVRFMSVDGASFAHTQESFVFPNGNLSHTIDQSVKVTVSPEGKIEGTVDFYDSRGCSYKDYKVSGEFRSNDEVNFVMTIPRYKIVQITVGHAGYYYDRPLFCWARSAYYPYQSYRYICGREQAHRSTRQECRLVETVQVPVSLLRF